MQGFIPVEYLPPLPTIDTNTNTIVSDGAKQQNLTVPSTARHMHLQPEQNLLVVVICVKIRMDAYHTDCRIRCHFQRLWQARIAKKLLGKIQAKAF